MTPLRAPEVADLYLKYLDFHIRSKENEVRQSEHRVAFLLALVTVFISVFATFSKDGVVSAGAVWPLIHSLMFLFGIGILTFSKVIWSRRYIEELDEQIGNIASQLKRLHRSLDDTLSNPFSNKSQGDRPILANLNGSLAQFLYTIEGSLAAAIVYVVCASNGLSTILTYVLVLLTFSTVAWMLFRWSQWIKSIKVGGPPTNPPLMLTSPRQKEK